MNYTKCRRRILLEGGPCGNVADDPVGSVGVAWNRGGRGVGCGGHVFIRGGTGRQTDGLDSPDSLNGTKLLGGSQDKNSKRGKTNESGAEAETNEGIGVLGVQRKGESPAAIFCITEVFLCPKSARRVLQES